MTASSCTVLNVDDNGAARYARCKILERAGYRVRDASTGSEALKLARSEHPALIVLDVKLPDISGLDVCRQLKHDPMTTAILVLQISAYYRSSDDHAVALECADSYLTEPVRAARVSGLCSGVRHRLHRREEQYRRLLQDVRVAPRENQTLQPSQTHPAAREEIRRLTDQLRTVEEHELEKSWPRVCTMIWPNCWWSPA